jgi:5'-nucleotidase
LNVNIPPLSEDKIKGIKVTKQGRVYFKDRFEKREDPRGRQYYWMTGESVNPTDEADLDSTVLENGYVSITPIHYELTNTQFFSKLTEWDFS